MADVTPGTVRGTGNVSYPVGDGVTITTGMAVSLISGKLQKSIATNRASAAACIGIAVSSSTAPSTLTGIAGERIAVGDNLALRAVGTTWKLFKKRFTEQSVGIATTAKLVGQTVTYRDGRAVTVSVATGRGQVIDLGVAISHKTFYCLSSNAGKICPITDLGAGEYYTLMGWGDANSQFVLNVVPFDNPS